VNHRERKRVFFGELKSKTPERAAFEIKPAGFECVFEGGISRMDFRADTTDSAVVCVLQERSDQAAANALIPPVC
jgi:hypothetical protein